MVTTNSAGFYLDIFLQETVKVVEEFGWVSKGKAQDTGATPTVEIVLERLLGGDQPRFDPECSEVVTGILREVLNMEPQTDYELKLQRIYRKDQVSIKDAALAASGVLVHFRKVWKAEREKQEAENRESSTSQHVGELKQRIDFGKVVCRGFITRSDEYTGHYYDIVKFETMEGDKLTWITSSLGEELTVGTRYWLTGTVKGHGEYRGIKETLLNRCKIKEEE